MTYEKSNLETLLKENVLTVTFTKKDGSNRVMSCTLRPDKLPPLKEVTEENQAQRKQSDTSIAVYDLEKNDWRSFRVDSVTDVQIAEEESVTVVS